MILFTGSGALAKSFSASFPCSIISARNMSDEELCTHLFSANVIIHNAAITSPSKLPAYIDSNFLLTKRILDLSFKTNPNLRFINISSMSILKKSSEYLRTEDMSDYAFSKFIAEQYCLRHPLKNIHNVRFSTIFYGNATRDGLSKLVYDAVTQNKVTIYNNGVAKRDFIPIDIAAAYLYKITQLQNIPRLINIASGESHSFKYVVDFLQRLNPALKIEDIVTKANNVLSVFSTKDIKKLGVIKFHIDEVIYNYIKILNENFNIQ